MTNKYSLNIKNPYELTSRIHLMNRKFDGYNYRIVRKQG